MDQDVAFSSPEEANRAVSSYSADEFYKIIVKELMFLLF